MERWWQVLVNVDKKPRKHLLSLKPGISESEIGQKVVTELRPILPCNNQSKNT